MIIHSKLKDGKSSIKATIEIEPDSLSISLPGNSACVNVIINGGKVTVYAYATENSDPEVTHLSTV